MKKISLVIATLLLIYACGNNETTTTNNATFEINANITDGSYTSAYLSEFKDGKMIPLDTSMIVNGNFKFTGSMDLPEVRYINFNEGKDIIPLFLENSKINISGSANLIDSVKVEGSKSNDDYHNFTIKLSSFDEKQKAIIEKFYALPKDANEDVKKALEAEYDAAETEKTSFIEDYIAKNGAKTTSAYIALRYLAGLYNTQQLEKLIGIFDPSISSSIYLKVITDKLAVMKNSMIGSPAPDFSQNDIDGNPIELSSFKGKYVLIDFWASWCAPCRAENPNVVAAYNKYNDKGFEVFGVSLDDNKEKWKQAIEKDGLTWSHVSDLKGWGNEAAKLYGVQSIPHSVLVDKEGNILAKNLRGEELHQKLDSIFSSESK